MANALNGWNTDGKADGVRRDRVDFSITIVETEHSAVALIISPLSSVCSGNGRRGRAPRSTMSA